MASPISIDIGDISAAGTFVLAAFVTVYWAIQKFKTKGTEADVAQLSAEDRAMLVNTQNDLRVMKQDMHTLLSWHAPDTNGVQGWKNPQMEGILREMLEELKGFNAMKVNLEVTQTAVDKIKDGVYQLLIDKNANR